MKTKSKILSQISLMVFVAFVSSLTYGGMPCTGTMSYILYPQYVSNPDNHMQDSNPYPPENKIALIIRWMGSTAADNAATWGVNYYTGFTPASPVSSYQRCSVNANPYTAFQMQGYGTGMFVNTYSFPWQSITGGGPNVNYVYKWSSSSYPTVFTSTDASFAIQMNAKMPWVYRPNAGSHPNSCVPQLSMTFAFNQTGTNKMLNWVVLLYDPRGGSYMNYENVQWDAYNQQAFISTSLSEGRSYITRGCGSNVTRSTTWSDSKYFRAHVTWNNMIAAANAANSFIGSSYYSTNPAAYKLVTVRAMLEISPWDYGTNASAGASISYFCALKRTD